MKKIIALAAGRDDLLSRRRAQLLGNIHFIGHGASVEMAHAALAFAQGSPSVPLLLPGLEPEFRNPLRVLQAKNGTNGETEREEGTIVNGGGEKQVYLFTKQHVIRDAGIAIKGVTQVDILQEMETPPLFSGEPEEIEVATNSWQPPTHLLGLLKHYNTSAVKSWAYFANRVLENLFEEIPEDSSLVFTWDGRLIQLAAWFAQGCRPPKTQVFYGQPLQEMTGIVFEELPKRRPTSLSTLSVQLLVDAPMTDSALCA